MTNPYYKNPAEELRNFFTRRNILSNLILINIAVWLLIKIAYVFFFLFLQPGTNPANDWVLHLFAVPANLSVLVNIPWTPFTYMFLHFDLLHILFNMLWLYWFGKIFLEFLKPGQMLQTYLFGGLTGALFYIAAYNFFPVFRASLPYSYALGASASVMAIVTAVSFYVPGYTIQLLFFGRVKIIFLAIILFIFDFFAIPGENSGGHIAHIGGAAWGFAYIWILGKLKGRTSSGFRFRRMKEIWDNFTKGKSRVNSSGKSSARPLSDEDYNLQKKANQKRVDDILEKISKGGYDSLTKAEKEFLFKSSGKDRQP